MKTVVNIYNKMSLPARASFWYFVCNVFQRGISVITTPIFTRILSTDQYGLVSIYTSWEAIITIFATLNFGAGVFNNAMVRYENDRNGYTSVIQTWTTIITGVIFFVYFLTRNFWNDILGLNTALMIMMFVDIAFTAGMSFWTVRNRYEYKYLSVCIFTLLASILVPLVSIVFTYLTDIHKSEAKIFGTVLVHIIIYGVVYILNLKNGKKVWNREYIVYSTKFSIPLIPHYLSQNVLNQADRIMIRDMVSIAKAGIYSVAYQAGMLINIVTSSVNASFVPYLYENLKEKNYAKIGNLAIKIELLIGSICFLFSLLAPELLKMLATEKYFEAIWIIPPVAMSSLFMMLYSFFTNVEFFFEKNKFIMVASVITAILNIVLNRIFITFYGYIAAGYTTLICYVIYAMAQYFFMLHICKCKNIPNPYNGGIMWVIALCFIVLSIFSEILYKTVLIRFIVLGILVVIVGVICKIYGKQILKLIRR